MNKKQIGSLRSDSYDYMETNQVQPAYDAGTIDKLSRYMEPDSYAAILSEIRSKISLWKQQTPADARLLMVSDFWVSGDNLGGSLLLRTFYGMLKELGLPVQWWRADVADSALGKSFLQTTYTIYEGMKGSAHVRSTLTSSVLEQYQATNRQLSAKLIQTAGLKPYDQVMLIDISALGLALPLRQYLQKGLIIENLRVASPADNNVYSDNMDFLRETGIYNSLDAILQLNKEYITDVSKESCIGAFCNFAHDHNQDIPAEQARQTVQNIVDQACVITNYADFEKFEQMQDQPVMLSRLKSPEAPDYNKLIYYHCSRIDPSKNIGLTLRSYEHAVRCSPTTMCNTELVMLMPSPNFYNVEVERQTMEPIIRELFDIYNKLDPLIQNQVKIYFVPPYINGQKANIPFNEALQNLAMVQFNISSAEGMPNAVFDCMSHKRVPLVSAFGGMLEQVEDGVSGFLVRENICSAISNAILRAAQHQDLPSLGAAAYETLVNRFNPLNYVNKYMDLLLHLMERKNDD